MEIFGIGPLELLLIVLLALIILGPQDMEKYGKKMGQGLYKFVRSDTWRTIRQASDKVKTLPNELMREAQIEELKKELNQPLEGENKIAPPAPKEESNMKDTTEKEEGTENEEQG